MTKTKEEHNKLISVLKNYLEDKGYIVKLEPHTNEYAGYMADIEAEKGGEKLCFEVVNGKNIDTPSMRKKWQAIGGNPEYDFGLFITKNKEEQIKKLLEEWGVNYRLVWRYTPEILK